ncbi:MULTISPECIES: ABC transporter substrate-binding protein [unclassified Caballeronia]|uniref:ABC transporter substrate-binding protein n=1 Tax=unclassified Caballeronia TaxID=2646786 RepID=UPI0020297EEB|nr:MULTISPECIES: ABC transporter substrate-binding protein [unclassified Caballeronia]
MPDPKRRRLLGGLAFLPFTTLVQAATHVSVPVRVASLSWAGAQMLVSIGATPLALAERDSYPETGALPVMPAGVLELGSHGEPNLELLAQLKPDLIVRDDDQSNLDAQLRFIAPTHSIDIYDAQRGKPYARAAEETRRLAAVLNREPEASIYLADVDRQIAEYAQKVAKLNVRPALVVDLYDDGRHLFVYGPNSMLHDVMTRLGVRNAWHGDTNSGFALLDIEDLASMHDAQLFYISHGERDDFALRNLSRSLLWRSLPFVAAGRVHPLPGFFTYGASSCAVQFATGLADGLTVTHG